MRNSKINSNFLKEITELIENIEKIDIDDNNEIPESDQPYWEGRVPETERWCDQGLEHKRM